jgi:predicted aconitase with swiveling domain
MSRVVNLLRAWGPAVQAPLLVMREGFSPRYDLDRWSGVISRIGHSAEGASIRGCILVIPTTKGGVAGGWAFHDLLHKGIAPAGLVFGKLNPVMVQGAVLAGIPVAEGLTAQDLQTLASGEMVRLDPMARTLTVVALR